VWQCLLSTPNNPNESENTMRHSADHLASLNDLHLPPAATLTAPCCGYAAVPGVQPEGEGLPYRALLRQVGETHPMIGHCRGCGAIIEDNFETSKGYPGWASDFYSSDRHPLVGMDTGVRVTVADLEARRREVNDAFDIVTWESRWERMTDPYMPSAGGNPMMALVIEVLRQARSYIHLLAYSPLAGAISDAIVEMANAGVDVRVIYDEGQTKGRPLQSSVPLSAAASLMVRPATSWTPGSGTSRPQGRRRDKTNEHGKLLIVDGRVAVSGSMNLTYYGTSRAARGELPELLVDPRDVQELNNRVFVDRWYRAGLSDAETAAVGEAGARSVGDERYGSPLAGPQPASALRDLAWMNTLHVRATTALGVAAPKSLYPVAPHLVDEV
jgi:hypothetical protein